MKKFYVFAMMIVILACLSQETDARRKILRGRKTITRTYFREAVMPAWAAIVLVGFFEMIIGGIVYIVFKKLILDRPVVGFYAPASVRADPEI